MKKILITLSSIMSILLLIVSCYMGKIFIDLSIEKKNYETYMNEEALIQFKIDGFNGYDVPLHQYENTFHQFLQFYALIEENPLVSNVNLAYSMRILFQNTQYLLMGSPRMQLDDIQLSQGRTFTEEELNQGSHVVIVSDEMQSVEVGDTLTLTSFEKNQIQLESKVLVIGKYNSNHKHRLNHEKMDEYKKDYYMYLPNKTIEDISNQWLNQYNKDYDLFVPTSILDVVYECNREADYVEIKEMIRITEKMLNKKMAFYRLDDHFDDKYGSIDKTKEKYDFLLSVILICIGIWLLIIFIIYFVYQSQKKKYQDLLISEQEKNVTKIMAVNQESHQLKHDLKHFFNQLSGMIEQNKVNDVLQFIQEYQEDIEGLDIPAYTKNNTLDLLINQYIQRAKQEKLDFTFSTIPLLKLNIADRKLYLLLSNALDNAFVHCNPQKSIHLKIDNVGEYCRFMITNTIGNDSKNSCSDKEHGYGMMSMKQIIDENHGELHIEIVNDIYCCVILLPLPNMHQN